jgi:hypothetical protein
MAETLKKSTRGSYARNNMSRFNEYTTYMEQSLDFWYQELSYHRLQELHEIDNITKEIQQTWYKFTYQQKHKIHERVNSREG